MPVFLHISSNKMRVFSSSKRLTIKKNSNVIVNWKKIRKNYFNKYFSYCIVCKKKYSYMTIEVI